MKCIICGKPTGRNKYCCSMQCYSKFRRHYKICVVCGKVFPSPPTAQVKTCGPNCSKQYRSQLHSSGTYDASVGRWQTGKEEFWAEHTGENHINSRHWVIQDPDGNEYEINNLAFWAREHADLLPGSPSQFADGIRIIKKSFLGNRKRAVYQYKGWRLIDWKD